MPLLTNEHRLLLKQAIWSRKDLHESQPLQDILSYLNLEASSSEGYLARTEMLHVRTCKYCLSVCEGQDCTYCWESAKGMINFTGNQLMWKFTPAGQKLLENIRSAAARELNSSELGIYQDIVAEWCKDTFGVVCASDPHERGLRLLEEALEAAQAVKVSKDRAHLLVEYVYGRPTGEISQEISGVFITLLALSAANKLDAESCLMKELRRITAPEFQEEIRAKHATKMVAGVSDHRGS